MTASKKVATPQVGQLVQYVGNEGTTMAAVVILTEDTYKAEMDPTGNAKPADATSVSLKVTRPVSGRSYVRHNVPLEGSLAHMDLVEAADAYAEALAKLPEAAKMAVGMGVTWYSDEEGEHDVPELPAKPVVRTWRPLA